MSSYALLVVVRKYTVELVSRYGFCACIRVGSGVLQPEMIYGWFLIRCDWLYLVRFQFVFQLWLVCHFGFISRYEFTKHSKTCQRIWLCGFCIPSRVVLFHSLGFFFFCLYWLCFMSSQLFLIFLFNFNLPKVSQIHPCIIWLKKYLNLSG